MTGIAYVSLIQHEPLRTHPNGRKYPMTYYYVRFQKSDGLETEARLLNPNKKLNWAAMSGFAISPGVKMLQH